MCVCVRDCLSQGFVYGYGYGYGRGYYPRYGQVAVSVRVWAIDLVILTIVLGLNTFFLGVFTFVLLLLLLCVCVRARALVCVRMARLPMKWLRIFR